MEKPINVFNIYGGTQNNMGATIEVQNIYVGNDMKTQSVNTHVGSPLATEQAMAIWQKTAAKGWTDTQGHIINFGLLITLANRLSISPAFVILHLPLPVMNIFFPNFSFCSISFT